MQDEVMEQSDLSKRLGTRPVTKRGLLAGEICTRWGGRCEECRNQCEIEKYEWMKRRRRRKKRGKRGDLRPRWQSQCRRGLGPSST